MTHSFIETVQNHLSTTHIGKGNKHSSMGGGTMHVDHLVPQLRNNLNNNFSSSSSTSSSNLQPSLPTDNNTNNTLSSCCCNNGQLCRKQEITATGCVYNHVFETVSSQREVQDAISALQE
jgi:hypothetical protein